MTSRGLLLGWPIVPPGPGIIQSGGGGGGVAIIGGYANGAAGAAGTPMAGFVQSWGDDFETLDIVGPLTPKGQWFPNRTYFSPPRGSDTLLGTMYDMDPLHTGHNDSNRGVPLGIDNMRVSASVLTLQARRATPTEQNSFSPTDASINGGKRTELGAVIDTAGAIQYNPRAGGEILIRTKTRISLAANNPLGFHPDTPWSLSAEALVTGSSNELGFEGNSQWSQWGAINWGAGSGVPGPGPDGFYGPQFAHDGQWHENVFILTESGNTFYRDGVLVATIPGNGNSWQENFRLMFTAHVYNGTWNGDTYSAADWATKPDGAKVEVDFVSIWRRPSASHHKPLVTIPDLNLGFGTSGTITLPSKLSLWGDANVVDYVQVVPFEENEPGNGHSVTINRFPAGVTYDDTTRTLTCDFASDPTGKAGRLHFIVAARTNGSTCEPARFCVNRGPRTPDVTIPATAGAAGSFDLYGASDVGRITPKTTAITGTLPNGFSLTNGVLNWTSAVVQGNTALTYTVTNSAGQPSTGNLTVSVGAAAVSSFSDNFDVAGGAAGPLENRAGWTRLDGMAGGITTENGSLRLVDTTTAGSAYVSPDLGAGNKRLTISIAANIQGFYCHRLTDRNNFIGMRRGTGAVLEVFRRVGGSLTSLATFAETVVGTDVIDFDDLGTTFAVRKNGVALTPTAGSLTFPTTGMPPASTRNGVVARSANISGAGDNYSTIRL